jgi:hypothetical protein
MEVFFLFIFEFWMSLGENINYIETKYVAQENQDFSAEYDEKSLLSTHHFSIVWYRYSFIWKGTIIHRIALQNLNKQTFETNSCIKFWPT